MTKADKARQAERALTIEQAAAVHVLRAVGLYGADLKPTGETEPAALEAQWQRDALMQSLAWP